jgi:hypothetical protein
MSGLTMQSTEKIRLVVTKSAFSALYECSGGGTFARGLSYWGAIWHWHKERKAFLRRLMNDLAISKEEADSLLLTLPQHRPQIRIPYVPKEDREQIEPIVWYNPFNFFELPKAVKKLFAKW